MKGIERAVDFYKSGVTTVYNNLVGLEGLKRIATDCKDIGANYFVVDLCTPVIKNNEILPGFSIEPHQMARDIMEMQPFLDKLYDGNVEIAIYIPLCLFPESFIESMAEKRQLTTICQVYGRSGINFDVNGDVILCNQLFDTIIAKKDSDFIDGPGLLTHLNSKAICDDYKQLLRYPDQSCTKCRWNLECRGGCLLNWIIYDPSICNAVVK
jgi:radical SAM protein with 4Fe4S-binding SPASM domain